jgi:hypothetical protein
MMEFIGLRLGSILEPARASQQPRCSIALNDPNARERKGAFGPGPATGDYPCTGASRLKRSFCSPLSEP